MTVVGDALTFGIAADYSTLVTQKVSINSKIDKKEAKDKGGKVIAVSLYNKTMDITIDGLGTCSQTVGSALSLSGTPPTLQGVGIVGTAAYATEVNLDLGNEEFQKTSIKATCWEGI